MGGGELFKVETAWDETTQRRVRAMVAQCSKCPRRSTVADNAGKARPPVYFADRFRRKGWRIGARANAHLCPHCVGGMKPKPALMPAQKQAAFCRIAGVPRAATSPAKPKEAVMSKPVAAPALTVVADAPRQPTRTDIGKILDALGDCYLRDKNCYAKDGSDEGLAKRLNMPRAWIAAERERAFGPDACEADAVDGEKLRALEAVLKVRETEATELALALESLRGEVRAALARLAKRGVA